MSSVTCYHVVRACRGSRPLHAQTAVEPGISEQSEWHQAIPTSHTLNRMLEYWVDYDLLIITGSLPQSHILVHPSKFIESMDMDFILYLKRCRLYHSLQIDSRVVLSIWSVDEHVRTSMLFIKVQGMSEQPEVLLLSWKST
jgi:hypothetical protein